MRPLLLLLALAACSEEPRRHFNPPPRFPPGIEMGPQLALATPTSIVVAWRTFEPVRGGVECAGRTAGGGEPTREHVVRLDGLTPGASYRYRLLHDGAAVEGEYEFAAPAEAGPFRFAVVGDSGSGCDRQFAVAAVMAAAKPALILHTGDVAYPTATREAMVYRHFVPYADLLARVPFYTVMGDHELWHEEGKVVQDLFYLPGNERYYSFERGNCHFVALDSNLPLTPGSPQRTWLEKDLATAAGARWRIAAIHHPPYSSCPKHGSIERVRDICALLERHRVHLLFCGNDHVYERSFPLRDDRVVNAKQEPDYKDTDGTVYVVTGGGGQVLYRSRSSYFTATARSVWHAVFVDVEDNRLTVWAVDDGGKEFDRFTLARTDRP